MPDQAGHQPGSPPSAPGKPPQEPSLADLRGPALSCLLALQAAGQPAKVDWLKHVSGFGRDALRHGLNILAEFGLARYCQAFRAWILTEAGINFIPSAGCQPASLQDSPENPADTQALNPHLPEKPAGNSNDFSDLTENQSSATGFSVGQVKEENPLNLLSESVSSRLCSEGRTQPENQSAPPWISGLDVPRLLQLTRGLFGEPLLGSPASYQEPWRLLAVIAEIYHNRHQFRKPARVAYKAYQQGQEPSETFWNNPGAYLPADFVTQLDLPPPDYARSWSIDPLEDPPRPGHPAGGKTIQDQTRPGGLNDPPKPPGCCAPGVDLEQAELWYRSLVLMSAQTSLVAYRRYVVDLVLVEHDLQAGLFTIGCRDAGHQAWVDDRIRSLLQRLMVGVWGRAVQVRFVVWPDPGDA